jgi:hypothetical protein
MTLSSGSKAGFVVRPVLPWPTRIEWPRRLPEGILFHAADRGYGSCVRVAFAVRAIVSTSGHDLEGTVARAGANSV